MRFRPKARERNGAGQALRDSEALKAAIVEIALDAIITIDHEGRITEFNPAAERTFGFSRADVIGQQMADLIIPPALREAHRRGVARYLATGEGPVLAKRIELTALRADGAEFPVELTISRMPVSGPPQFTAFLRDITERKRAGAELVRTREAALDAVKLKSEFVANMSHEMRTPMTSIIGMTELALDTELTPDQRELLEIAKASADSLLVMLNGILDFSKIEAGTLALVVTPFGLRDCVGNALEGMAIRAHQKGLELVCDMAPDVPDRLAGDSGRLRQVILNFVDNAIKFSERGEIVFRIELETRSETHVGLRFSVRDAGIGVLADKQRLIFDAFTQVDGSSTRPRGVLRPLRRAA